MGTRPMTEADMPPATIDTDICVIGAGSGGLSVAAGLLFLLNAG